MSAINIFNSQKVLDLNVVECTTKLNYKIGIFIHIYYTDIIEEIINISKKIENSILGLNDESKLLFYISTDTYDKKSIINKLFKEYIKSDITIKVLQNKGRDIAPFLVGFAEEIKKVDILLKLYTKKSIESIDGYEDTWRKFIYKSLCRDEQHIKNILFKFKNDTNIGMIIPPHLQNKLRFITIDKPGLNNNLNNMNKLLKRMFERASITQNSWIDFPSDSMFWAKPESLLPMINLNFKYSEFADSASIKKEGDLVHAIERLFLYTVVLSGYQWCRIDIKDLDIKNQCILQSISIENFLRYVDIHTEEDAVDNSYYTDLYLSQEKELIDPVLHYKRIGQHINNYPNLSYEKKCLSIKNSKLFDEQWYKVLYNYDLGKLSPEYHYMSRGWKKGFNPSKEFDTNKYLIRYPDVASLGINPLSHYETYGKKEKRKIYPVQYYDENYYNNLNYKQICDNSQLIFEATFKSDIENSNVSRIAIFSFYNENSVINDDIIYCLQELKNVTSKILFIADCYVPVIEINKISHLIDYCYCEKHCEYDFGSYKRGFLYSLTNIINEHTEEIIFCNDSCYGPIYSLKNLFCTMSNVKCDFWGLTHNYIYGYHIQSYFIVFKRNVFLSDKFYLFIESIVKKDNYADIIRCYEVRLTQYLMSYGYKPYTVDNDINIENNYGNITFYPLKLLENKIPLVKKKCFDGRGFNIDGVVNTLKYILDQNKQLFNIIVNQNKRLHSISELKPEVFFSIIMPTYNRKCFIANAIDSVLNQNYNNYELIIVDDASYDGTEELILHNYGTYIDSEKIKFLKLDKNMGASTARNHGLLHASYDWIAYVDSDNKISKDFLRIFSDYIRLYPEKKTFYCQFEYEKEKIIIGKSFNYEQLMKANFIDIGTFVHHVDIFKELGGFDENLNRLVDWDLILRYTKLYTPIYIQLPLMSYNSDERQDRISISNNYHLSHEYVISKNRNYPKITTIIVSHNQEEYIHQSIESALMQKGKFQHQILISDDGSTDHTHRIIEKYSKKYPMVIKDISLQTNLGISGNYKHALRFSRGDYIAVLEGDDYWTSPNKLQTQLDFLISNNDCSMVFSKVDILDTTMMIIKNVAHQSDLPHKINCETFLKSKEISLIVNFSTCMFRSEIIKNVPQYFFNYRFSELTLAFYFLRFGLIGYLNKPSSVYRKHDNGVFSGADIDSQLYSKYIIRLETLLACPEAYQEKLYRYYESNIIKAIDESKISRHEIHANFLGKLQNEYKSHFNSLLKKYLTSPMKKSVSKIEYCNSNGLVL